MTDRADLISLTADITASFVASNHVGAGEVAGVIQSVHAALAGLGTDAPAAQPERPEPAVSIRKSVQPDYLVNLFTGKKLKTLKRNLATAHGMTPAEYRSYWGLPATYPMVAPNYSDSRKAMAKAIGLGRKAGATTKPEAAAASPEKASAPAKAASPAKASAATPPAKAPRAARKAPAAPAKAKLARKPRAPKVAPQG